jgi:hypothetical protein
LVKHLFFTTVRVSNGFDPIGTAFLYQPNDADTMGIRLITNTHIAARGASEPLHLHMLGAHGDEPMYGEEIVHQLATETEWISHSNSDVDLSAIHFEPVLNALVGRGVAPYFETVREWGVSLEEYSDFDWIEDVTFIGYPAGLHDAINLTPIARRGITATPFHLDWQEIPAFLIDASALPGSSGSPVFSIRKGLFRNRAAYSPGISLAFLGALDKTIGSQSGDDETTRTYNNLGIVYKWSAVAELSAMVV